MFGVDGQKPLRLALDEIHHELSADDEALLVGEREGLAALEGGQRGTEAGCTHKRVHDDVGIGVPREHFRCVRTGEYLDARDRSQAPPQLDGRGLVRHRHVRGNELADLSRQEFEIVACRREPDDLEPVGVAPDDVQRLGSDRACGSEHDERAHIFKGTPGGPNLGSPEASAPSATG